MYISIIPTSINRGIKLLANQRSSIFSISTSINNTKTTLSNRTLCKQRHATYRSTIIWQLSRSLHSLHSSFRSTAENNRTLKSNRMTVPDKPNTVHSSIAGSFYCNYIYRTIMVDRETPRSYLHGTQDCVIGAYGIRCWRRPRYSIEIWHKSACGSPISDSNGLATNHVALLKFWSPIIYEKRRLERCWGNTKI